MKTRNRTGILSMATLASAVLMSSAADARELNYALGAPRGHRPMKPLSSMLTRWGALRRRPYGKGLSIVPAEFC